MISFLSLLYWDWLWLCSHSMERAVQNQADLEQFKVMLRNIPSRDLYTTYNIYYSSNLCILPHLFLNTKELMFF